MRRWSRGVQDWDRHRTRSASSFRVRPPRVGRPRVGRLAAQDLTRRDKAFFVAFEGGAPPTSPAVAKVLGISPSAAYRLMARLRQRGVMKVVSGRARPSQSVEAVCLLRLDLLDLPALDALEERMISDPAVLQAAWVSGPMSFRVQSLHRDTRAAHAWFRDLVSQPGVLEARQRLLRVLLDRPHYARALWAQPEPSPPNS